VAFGRVSNPSFITLRTTFPVAISQKEEWKRLTSLIAKSMGETFKLSNELYAEFPDIMPDELKSDPKPD
jgi:hypothetical protein